MAQAVLTLQVDEEVARVDATRVRFSAHRCIARDGADADRACLDAVAARLVREPGLAMCVEDRGAFLRYFLEQAPALRAAVTCVVVFDDLDASTTIEGFPVVTIDVLQPGVHTAFLCETLTFPRMRMRRKLPKGLAVLDLDMLPQIALDRLPARAWTPWGKDTIYPIDVPEIEFEHGLDVLLLDCPARNLGLMPNGVGYVHNVLKHTSVRFQTRDLDIILYHRFHIRRLFDEGGVTRLASGRELPTDPWQAEHYDLWSDKEVLASLAPEVEEIARKVIAARPKVLAMSIHACNEHFTARVIERVKAGLPEVIVLVGGFSCYSADIGLRGFPQADYMCIGEADLTVGALVEQLAAGERPKNLPGVISKFDNPALPFIPGPMPHDLDLLDHPHYDWYDLSVYRNYNGYQLTPVIASRGCRWSRCTFCAERFYWRIRSPKVFVDELEWLVDQGCRLFMFNESDLNGMPELVLEICDEIIRRELNVKLTGQLRIHKKSDRAFYFKMREAGFVALRFGVDAFSENTLRLQKKGYTTATVHQNMKDCWEAGIYTEVNWVIGVPGETEQDVDEGIEFILANKPYIGRLANINPLILVNGGVYWLEPEKHNIHFRESKDELFTKFPRAIPAHLWYSTEPHIDEFVRKSRFERIVLALHDGGFDVGAWAARVIEDVRKNRDMARGGARLAAQQAAEDKEAARIGAENKEAARLSAEGPVSQPEPAAPASADAAAGAARVRLSDGVGRMEKSDAEESRTLEFNADARSAAYVFRAGSSLPEDKIVEMSSQFCLVRQGDELFGIDAEVLGGAFGAMRAALTKVSGRTVDVSDRVHVRFASTKAAVPELVRSIGNYNIVMYDALYYGVPQELGARPWGEEDIAALPGVITAATVGEVSTTIEHRLGIVTRRAAARAETLKAAGTAKGRKPSIIPMVPLASPARRMPSLVASLNGYNIVEFEGWFYGMPQSLGEIHLDKTDVIEMPGVIRDLSREVVEGEIREAIRIGSVSV